MSHVLITRPLPAAQELADQVKAAGLTPVVAPLYGFAAHEPEESFEFGNESGARKLAVFTSPRAVSFGAKYLPGPGLPGPELAVVGSSTRKALEDLGYKVHVQAESGYTSEDLLQARGLRDDPGIAVIFCAPGGRQKLAHGLAELGWVVTKALVYQRIELGLEHSCLQELRRAGQLISTWTSNSAADIAQKRLPEALWRKILESPMLVISRRMQRHMEAMGASRVRLAGGPANQALLQSILEIRDRYRGD